MSRIVGGIKEVCFASVEWYVFVGGLCVQFGDSHCCGTVLGVSARLLVWIIRMSTGGSMFRTKLRKGFDFSGRDTALGLYSQ